MYHITSNALNQEDIIEIENAYKTFLDKRNTIEIQERNGRFTPSQAMKTQMDIANEFKDKLFDILVVVRD